MQFPFTLEPEVLLGALSREADETPIYGAAWYNAGFVNDGLDYRFAVGALAGARYLTADMLLEGWDAGVFVLELQEGADGPQFEFYFALLPEVSARMQVPLEAVQQNRWLYARAGAWVKPRVAGERVDLERVDRMRIRIARQGETYTRWCMTPVIVTLHDPLPLAAPALSSGDLVDEFGQSALHDWEGKSHSSDEISERLQSQLRDAPGQRWPESYSGWGGWTARRFEATGFFRSHWDTDSRRWWLIDPEGHAFWSSGQDCVRASIESRVTHLEQALRWLPDDDDYEFATIVHREKGETTVDYLQANLMRAFGPNAWYSHWATITLGELRRGGFNTIGNWSEWEIARDARFPYVRPLKALDYPRAPRIFRDLPDVYDPRFDEDATEIAQQLADGRDDPALIGYFLMNEPTWGFAQESPALGMLYSTSTCMSRNALATFLRERYGDEATLAATWGFAVTFEDISQSRWTQPVSEAAEADLDEFSGIMVERYFATLSSACRNIDPNHLNLGVRYYTIPPDWCLPAMHSFDVFSMNCYRDQVPGDMLKIVHERLNKPTLIGEWHMGAMDAGLPATGVGPRLRDQAARGQAYRVYLENAAALPWCVGVHHFTYYDQPALGRFDGEAYQIGLYDICNRPYEPVIRALRQSHERLYSVALGESKPFSGAPDYLPAFYF